MKTSHVLLTGPPGIGKTTVCKKVATMLQEKGLSFDGFYTEEVRDQSGCRIGFDIVGIEKPDRPSQRAPLARLKSLTQETQKNIKPQVGNYCVFLDNFETIALPVLDSNSNILLIDEIGKMELFSKDFKRKVMDILFSATEKVSVLGTIPQIHKAPQQHAALFEKLHTDERIKILSVSHKDRNKLPEEIIRNFV